MNANRSVIGRLLTLTLVTLCLIDTANAGWCKDCWCAKQDGECPKWRPQNYTSDMIEKVSQQKPLNQIKLPCKAYTNETCTTEPAQLADPGENAVCGHQFANGCDEYSIENYRSAEEAKAAGAVITHYGQCGACSTRQDLSVYMKYMDMTKPGKKCGIRSLLSHDSAVTCFENLGMTEPCAQIWAQNAAHTSKNCFGICIIQLFYRYNGAYPMCELNTCLECDEINSGPVFQKVAGRTRRNTGLESGITRPCKDVIKLEHEECPATTSSTSNINQAEIKSEQEIFTN